MINKTKTMQKSTLNIKLLAATAMFAALVTVATAFIKIPSMFGYTHPGDSMIYLAASILPGPYGILAASIGGALADLISGYPQWAIPTAIIKALNAVPFVLCSLALKNKHSNNKIITLPSLLMLVPTSSVTIFGYFIANTLMYSYAGAVAELATWWLQPGLGAIIFVLIGITLDKMKFKDTFNMQIRLNANHKNK